MNTKHISLALTAIAALLVGCTKNPSEESGRNDGQTDLELSYVGSTEVKSAIDGTDFPQTGEIGLFLFKDETAETPYGDTGYANVKYLYNSTKGKWTASPSIKVGGTPGYLYGYYPYSSTATNIKAIPVSSSLNGDDVMYASKQNSPITDETASQTAITMNHALARVAITVKNNGYTGNAKLTSIKFEGAKIAGSGTLDATSGSITATTADNVTLSVPEAIQTITKEGTLYECFLAPSEVVSGKQDVTLSLTIDGQVKTVTLKDDNGVIIARNTKSNITIALSNSGVSVQTVFVEDWNEVAVGGHKVTIVEAPDVTANDIVYKAYADGENAIIKASSESNKSPKCTTTGTATVSKSKTGNVYTFTISNISSNITATLGYEKPLTVTVSSNDSAWGTATYEGIAYEGETVVFKATANYNYGFVEWQDESGKTLSTDNPYSVTLTSNLNVKAVFEYTFIDGALPGVFTVGIGVDGIAGTADDVKVWFSKGNLYAKKEDGKWTWNFYDEQYGNNSLNSKCDEDGKREATESDTEIDLFYWGLTSSSLNPIGVGYVAAHTHEFEELVHYKPSSKGGDDWGVAFCESNNIAVGIWRTLSIAEWEYLFKNHNKTWATVHGVTGYIFAPDNFAGNLAKSYADDAALETDNLLFLPAVGWRRNKYVLDVGKWGYYWSSSADNNDCAYFLFFDGDGINVSSTGRAYNGHSIRLVTDCQR